MIKRIAIVLLLTILPLLIAAVAHAQAPFVNYKVTPAVAGSLVVCPATSGCNLYSYQVRSGAAAGFLMFFAQATVPADGAVTPVLCVDVAANSTVAFEYRSPIGFPTGMTVAFSTTGCFTKTISATAFINVGAQ
jgi:hypothetical protein